MPKKKKRWFDYRVLCSRVAGGMDPDPDRPRLAREVRQVYARVKAASWAEGATLAEKKTREVMGRMGWDRFKAAMTIADEERLQRFNDPDPYTLEE